jgi:hypothetical protein
LAATLAARHLLDAARLAIDDPEVTVAERGGTLVVTARRSRAMPVSAAATIPRSGRPTAATQEPAADAPATRARASEPDRLTATVLPRRRPESGRSGRKAAGTGRRCSAARVGGWDRRPSASATRSREADGMLRWTGIALRSNSRSRLSRAGGSLAFPHFALRGACVR